MRRLWAAGAAMVVCLVFAPQPTAAQPLVAPTPPPATSGSLAVTITDLEDREKKLIGGEWVEVPVMLTGPTDVALLIDRFQVLFDGPSTISEGCGVNVTSGMLPIDALQAIIERTRGLAAPDPQASPIPRAPRRLDDSTVCLRSCGIHGLRAMDPCRIPKAAAGRVSSGHFSNSRSATCPTPTRP